MGYVYLQTFAALHSNFSSIQPSKQQNILNRKYEEFYVCYVKMCHVFGFSSTKRVRIRTYERNAEDKWAVSAT